MTKVQREIKYKDGFIELQPPLDLPEELLEDYGELVLSTIAQREERGIQTTQFVFDKPPKEELFKIAHEMGNVLIGKDYVVTYPDEESQSHPVPAQPKPRPGRIRRRLGSFARALTA